MTALAAFALASLRRRAGKAFALGFGLALTVMLVAAVILWSAKNNESDTVRHGWPSDSIQRRGFGAGAIDTVDW